MNTVILVIWTVVAVSGSLGSYEKHKAWRPIGEFSSLTTCNTAAEQLGLHENEYRCLQK